VTKRRARAAPAYAGRQVEVSGERASAGVGCRLGEKTSIGRPLGARRGVGSQSTDECRRKEEAKSEGASWIDSGHTSEPGGAVSQAEGLDLPNPCKVWHRPSFSPIQLLANKMGTVARWNSTREREREGQGRSVRLFSDDPKEIK
jgi:hypothetical protein